MPDTPLKSTGIPVFVWKLLEAHYLFPAFALVLSCFVWLATQNDLEIERKAMERSTVDSIQELAETYEAQIIRNLDIIDQSLKTIKFAYEHPSIAPSLRDLEEKELLPPSMIFTAAVTDRHGKIVSSTRDTGQKTVAGTEAFSSLRSGDAGQLVVGHAGKEGLIQFSRRINGPDGRFAGAVMLLVEPGYFTSGYERSRLGERGVFALVDSQGGFLARRSGEEVTHGGTASGINFGHGETRLAVNPWDGEERFFQTRRLQRFPLTVVVGLSHAEKKEALKHTKHLYLWGAATITLLLALAASGMTWLSWRMAAARRRHRKEQATYFAAAKASLVGVFVLRRIADLQDATVDFVLDNINERAEEMIRGNKDALIGLSIRRLLPRRLAEAAMKEFETTVETGESIEAEWRNRHTGIRPKWLYRQVVRIEDGVVVIIRDISERKEAEERISHMAHHDALTGLPNRTLLDDRIQHAIANAQRNHRTIAVLFVDLDDFKLVNDSLGHKVGDELLKAVASKMQQCLRQTDTVLRLGGDEFVIVMGDLPEDTPSLLDSLQRIRAAVIAPLVLGEQTIEISASIGVALYPGDGATPEALLMNADAAMYQAKALGRNRYLFFTPEMNRNFQERLALQDGLRHALERDEFFLTYQPQVDLRSGQVIGVEALIRWLHPEMGLISPADFIGLAEESGIIGDIGEWVLKSACSQCKAWQDAGLPPLVVGVNVSARQFRDNSLIELVREALAESDLHPSYLELELTESLIMQDIQQAVALMRELRNLGVRLSIDDFGSGYSSLSSLKSFPIARLKIDRLFVTDLLDNDGDQAIARMIVSLGKTLNLRVLAEGIVNEGQRQFLLEHGCDEGQGYLFSAPVSATELEHYLRRQATGAQALDLFATRGTTCMK